MKRKLLLFMLGLFFVSAHLLAQQKTITGKVTDSQGQPLPGVTVSVKGTSTRTQTNGEGLYSIETSLGQILHFTYIGFQAQETAVGTSNVISVSLQSTSSDLNEVVVTAMGIKREVRSLGYAAQDIKSEELLKNKDPNIINSLNGKIAGVNITNSSGAPGASSSIVLRGGTSLERDNQPLFVIDRKSVV